MGPRHSLCRPEHCRLIYCCSGLAGNSVQGGVGSFSSLLTRCCRAPEHLLCTLASLGGGAELPAALSGSRAVKIWLLSCFLRLFYLISRIPNVDSDPGSFHGCVHSNLPLSLLLLPLPSETFTDKHHPAMTAWHRGKMCHCTLSFPLPLRTCLKVSLGLWCH